MLPFQTHHRREIAVGIFQLNIYNKSLVLILISYLYFSLFYSCTLTIFNLVLYTSFISLCNFKILFFNYWESEFCSPIPWGTITRSPQRPNPLDIKTILIIVIWMISHKTSKYTPSHKRFDLSSTNSCCLIKTTIYSL